jgi:N-acetylglucosaminyldiphosphoundecaprenol N-acetyl-beta-D-mannosaminyltransferase
MKVKILQTEIDCFTKKELNNKLETLLTANKAVKIGKVNTEFILRSKESKEFSETLATFDIKIADGSGVLWAGKYLSIPLTKIPFLRHIQASWQAFYSLLLLSLYPSYCCRPIPERFPGVEAFYMMIEAAVKTKSKVYFFGAEKNILESSIEVIKLKYPELLIAGWHDGYNFNNDEVIADINKQKPQLLIVALGSPKQEYWIRDNIGKLPSVRIAVGEGGSFDFVSGVHKRAPHWMRRAGIEWFWRMFMNKDKTGTSRVERIWRAVPVFVYAVIWDKIRNDS